MKVIFLKNVPKVAKINDIKEQPDGYVRNFLVPKGFAIIATPEAIKRLERAQNEIRVSKEIQTDLFKKNLRAVEGMAVTISAKANDKGHLFQAIHAKDIVEALKKEHQVRIAPEYISIANPIKELGTFKAIAEAMGIKEEITVNVVSQTK